MNTIFASRWKALWFAASVMLTAYCSIPDASETPTEDAATAQEQADQVEIVMKDLQNSANGLKQYNAH